MLNQFIKLLFVFVIIFHVGMTVLYLLPANPATQYYSGLSKSYMNPIFSQNWNLFSPDPVVYNLRLLYRCEKGKTQWSNWFDPAVKLVRKHQSNRFLFKGKLIYVYHNLYRNLLNTSSDLAKKFNCAKDDAGCEKRFRFELKQTQEAKLVSKFVKTMCQKQSYNLKNEFKIVKVYPKKFSERHDRKATRPIVIGFDSRDYYATH